MKKTNSKLTVGNYIKKNISIDKDEKRKVLNKLPVIINEFKKRDLLLHLNKRGYILAESAKKLLTQNLKLIEDIVKPGVLPKKLEVWKEKELLKYTKCRGLG